MEDIVEGILPYERDLFLSLNNAHFEFWDYFMTIFSGKMVWIPMAITLLGIFVYKNKWKEALIVILAFVILITLCDQISSSVIKPLFTRFRPSRHPDFQNFVTIVDAYRGGRFGFISSHAANGFGIATFLSLIFRNKLVTLSVFTWATINAYSRIYLGVHFISDIIGGIIVGICLGFLVYYLYNLFRLKLLKIEKSDIKTSLYSQDQVILVSGTILTSILTIFTISYIAVSF